jgi:hypothetical protein
MESRGKFGKTEISDIIGFLALPDAKVFLIQKLFSMKLHDHCCGCSLKFFKLLMNYINYIVSFLFFIIVRI